MLSDLFDAEPSVEGWRAVAGWASGTMLTHGVLVVLLLAGGAGFDEPADLTPPEITYVDLEPVEPVPEPEPAFVPEPPPEPAEELPAGFQELTVPPDVAGIPEEVATDSVREADFGGRGVIGGVGDGVRGDGPVANSASELRPEPESRPLVVDDAFVTEPPVLLNVERVAAQMGELYPRTLRDMRVGGTVIAQFMVLEDGRVDPTTIVIVEADHPLLGEATRRAVRSLRFRPGRMLWDGTLQPVRVRTTMPLNWTLR